MYNHIIDTFLYTARLGSFRKAAEKLRISPVTVANHIFELEAEVGRQLIIRRPTGIQLTEQGELFLTECQQLVRTSYELLDKVRRSGPDQAVPLSIGLPPVLPLTELGRIIPDTPESRKYKLSLARYSAPDPAAAASFHEIVIWPGEAVRDSSPVHSDLLGTFRLSCLIPSDHPLARKPELTYEDLNGETLIFPSLAAPELARRFCDHLLLHYPDIAVETPPVTYDLPMLNHFACGHNFLVAPEIWGNIHPSLSNRPVRWNWFLPYCAVRSKNAREEVRNFISMIKSREENIL